MKMLLIILAAGLMVGCSKGSGSTEGKLVDVTYEGYVFKTCEVDLQYGEGASKIATYSTTDVKLCDQILALNGKKVQLNYNQTFLECFWCASDDLISSVKASE